jgi:hypothetical protein
VPEFKREEIPGKSLLARLSYRLDALLAHAVHSGKWKIVDIFTSAYVVKILAKQQSFRNRSHC